jgi:hypothetical protein
MKLFMTIPQLLTAIAITTICTLGIIAQQIWTSIVIDERTIFFIALGTLPWLTLFFRKFKIPGFEGESYDRTQSKTDNPPPPKAATTTTTTTLEPEEIMELTDEGKKILATLWKYQKIYFKDDYSRRWTFSIFPNSSAYPGFIRGLAELLNLGLVSISLDTNQVLLTNEGIGYIENNPVIEKINDIYRF